MDGLDKKRVLELMKLIYSLAKIGYVASKKSEEYWLENEDKLG